MLEKNPGIFLKEITTYPVHLGEARAGRTEQVQVKGRANRRKGVRQLQISSLESGHQERLCDTIW
jgi:hypothetical protein